MSTSKLNAPFVLFTLALILWSSAAALSSHLAQGHPTHKHGAEGGGEGHEAVAPAEASEAVKTLRKEVESKPESIEARLSLASALQQEAFERRDNNLLMEAVQSYSAILSKQPAHEQALLGMSALCFEAGILDKAVEYYERYLKVRPDDLRAKTDLALVHIQSEQVDTALTLLQEIIKENPKLFQAQLAMALAYKVQGKDAEAAAKEQEAKKLAPTDEDRARIDQFLGSFEQARKASAESKANLSPAQQVQQFFQNHPIVGPKLKAVSWPELNIAKVVVENFPVAQMPPFAKEKFLGNIREQLKNLPDKVEIKLYDSQTDGELLSVSVGGEGK